MNKESDNRWTGLCREEGYIQQFTVTSLIQYNDRVKEMIAVALTTIFGVAKGQEGRIDGGRMKKGRLLRGRIIYIASAIDNIL